MVLKQNFRFTVQCLSNLWKALICMLTFIRICFLEFANRYYNTLALYDKILEHEYFTDVTCTHRKCDQNGCLKLSQQNLSPTFFPIDEGTDYNRDTKRSFYYLTHLAP